MRESSGRRVGAGGEVGVTQSRPHACDRNQALPGDRLPVEPDHRATDVGRERLPVEQPGVAAPELALQAAQRCRQRRRLAVEKRAVAGEPEVVGGSDEHGTGTPVRVPRGQPPQREAQDRLGDVGVAVRRHDPRGVERLGEGELLVGVADAVAPREHALLHEQASLGVQDAALGDLEHGTAGELRVPESRDLMTGGVE